MRSLILIGAGTDQCTVTCTGEQYVIQVVQGRFAASGIAFEHIGPHFGSVIEAAGGEVDLYRCACSGGVFDGNRFCRAKWKVLGASRTRRAFRNGVGFLHSQTLENGLEAGSGLWLHGQATATVQECHFTNNEVSGIAEDDAQVKLTGNECTANMFNGISLCGSTRLRSSDNRCDRNKRTGISVRSDVDRTVEERMIQNNTCRANGEAGIGFWQQSCATACGNRCIGENTNFSRYLCR